MAEGGVGAAGVAGEAGDQGGGGGVHGCGAGEEVAAVAFEGKGVGGVEGVAVEWHQGGFERAVEGRGGVQNDTTGRGG